MQLRCVHQGLQHQQGHRPSRPMSTRHFVLGVLTESVAQELCKVAGTLTSSL